MNVPIKKEGRFSKDFAESLDKMAQQQQQQQQRRQAYQQALDKAAWWVDYVSKNPNAKGTTPEMILNKSVQQPGAPEGTSFFPFTAEEKQRLLAQITQSLQSAQQQAPAAPLANPAVATQPQARQPQPQAQPQAAPAAPMA